MATVKEMADRFKKLNLPAIGREALRLSKDGLVFLNQEQMLAGFKKDGSSLGTYRPFTIEKRREKGLQTAHVDLHDTGAFQDGMKLVVKGDTFDFTSTDSKTDKLADKYGDGIFGLTEQSKRIAWERYVRGHYARIIADKTGAKLG